MIDQRPHGHFGAQRLKILLPQLLRWLYLGTPWAAPADGPQGIIKSGELINGSEPIYIIEVDISLKLPGTADTLCAAPRGGVTPIIHRALPNAQRPLTVIDALCERFVKE